MRIHGIVRLTLTVLVAATILHPAFAGCEPGTPATPVPQFDEDLAPGVSLWPLDAASGEIKLRPAGLPAGITRDEVLALPLSRDSTQYDGMTFPGEFSGHELFYDVSIPGSRQQPAEQSDWLVVAYNVGLQIWGLGADPADPVLLQQADGHVPPFGPGDWAVFPVASEEDIFIHALDSLRDGDLIYIAVSADPGVGFSIWAFDTTTNDLEQLYQDLNVWSYDVALVEDPAGGVYAFAADLGGAVGNDGGVRVYDATAAAAGALCVDPAGSNPCGVFQGEVGDVDKSQFVTALAADGEIYVAASDGFQLGGPLALEIWEVTDPANPGIATLRFDGLGSMVFSPQLFSYDGRVYLALVENLGASLSSRDEVMRVYDVSSCVGGAGCAGLGTPLASETLAALPASFHYLDLSFSYGTPMLHYGVEGAEVTGSAFERLWDLGALPTPFAPDSVPEITDGGGTYVDPCNGSVVNYFGDYFQGNDNGLRNFTPRHAVFSGPHLYRAGVGVLDVHTRADPFAMFSDGFESNDLSAWTSSTP